jgi:DNA-binding transcriptional LysR family regulator
MALPLGLDPDLLRTFVLIAEGRSFTNAAAVVGRTQSAVSMQVKRLEEMLGQPVFARGKGGAVELTPHGTYLLARARQMLALNDEVMATFRSPEIAGRVRLGSPDDYALHYLPPILKRFAESHPAVEVDVTCAPSHELVDRLRADELDLTLCSEGNNPRDLPATPLMCGPLMWVTSARHNAHRQDPLCLALAHQKCAWRDAAVTALKRAGMRYRIAYTSSTQVGTHAPVLAGLAVTVSAISLLPEGVRPLRNDEGLPPLPDFGIVLLEARPRAPVTQALAVHIEESFRVEMSRGERVISAA